MPVDLAKFNAFYGQLFKIDFTGVVAGVRPALSTQAHVRAAIGRGAPSLPKVYQKGFFEPLNTQLPAVLAKLQQEVKTRQKTRADMTTTLEQIYAPIYQHGPKVTKSDLRPQLGRFLAVVSNLYRSFLDADKRRAAGVKLATDTPPLAFFQSASVQGPYTIESDIMRAKFRGMAIGIVSLPATYRDHPVIWAPLSHEVGGHDVVHADEGLVDELIAAVQAMFTPHFAPGPRTDAATLNALIWSYWMDEAVADVYGVLNMGPVFPISLAGYLAAYRAKRRRQKRPGKPVLSTEVDSRGSQPMDNHPVDILRLHLTLGAIDAMAGLNAAKRAAYVAGTEALAHAMANGATEIALEGSIATGHGQPISIKTTVPLADAAKAARQVGQMIASRRFSALNGHSIQDIETWDDADETKAEAIAAHAGRKQSIVGLGDDAQLLAGTTLALLAQPGLYAAVSKLLCDALDDSFRRDPIWGAVATAPAPQPKPRPKRKPKPKAKPAKKVSPRKAKKRSRRFLNATI